MRTATRKVMFKNKKGQLNGGDVILDPCGPNGRPRVRRSLTGAIPAGNHDNPSPP